MSAARIERLLNLLTLLLNTRQPVSLCQLRDLEEFSAYCGADPKSGERAFERDKAALVEMGIPLRYVAIADDQEDDSQGGYTIDRERYYLPDLQLEPSELALLSIAGAAAATIPGFPGRAAVISALAKLGFDGDSEARPIASIAHAPFAPGGDPTSLGENLAMLHDAVARRVGVHLLYSDLTQAKTARDVDPYGLYYRQGIWYLVGYCHLRGAERTFHLARITKVLAKSSGAAFTVPADFDLSYCAHRRAWEFPVDPPIEVTIALAPHLTPAIKEIFGDRALVTETASGSFVRIEVSHQAALIAAVLPYGADAKVVAPQSLRDEIARIYQQLDKRYQSAIDEALL